MPCASLFRGFVIIQLTKLLFGNGVSGGRAFSVAGQFCVSLLGREVGKSPLSARIVLASVWAQALCVKTARS